MSKLTLRVVEWRPLVKHSLRGFCAVHIDQLRLTIKDVAVHEKEGRRWAQLPAKAQIDRNQQLIRDQTTGKIQYASILNWDTRAVSDAFSSALIIALLEREPHAFDVKESAA